jgi:hypothetical protein
MPPEQCYAWEYAEKEANNSVTGGTYSGPPGAFFLQTVFWPTEVGGNASIGCCASPSPAMPMPKA